MQCAEGGSVNRSCSTAQCTACASRGMWAWSSLASLSSAAISICPAHWLLRTAIVVAIRTPDRHGVQRRSPRNHRQSRGALWACASLSLCLHCLTEPVCAPSAFSPHSAPASDPRLLCVRCVSRLSRVGSVGGRGERHRQLAHGRGESRRQDSGAGARTISQEATEGSTVVASME